MKTINGLSEIIDHYSAFLVDQFGVLHDGQRPYPMAAFCLRAMRDAGREVLVLSNSGRRAGHNIDRLQRLGFAADLISGVVTSGEVAWRVLAARPDAHSPSGNRCLLITEHADQSFADGLGLSLVSDPAEADFVLVVGVDTPDDTLEPYDSILVAALDRKLPMLCTNSDLIRLTPTGLRPAPGALAQSYAARGGEVTWYGKPLPAIFEHSLAQLSGIDRSRVAMIGDSLKHDIAGARAAGIASIYIQDGIGAGWTTARLEAEIEEAGARPDYVLGTLRW